MPTTPLRATDRSTLRRHAERGVRDRASVHAILDEALVCHAGFAVDGAPWVVPTAFARVGDHLYLHGASGSFALRSLCSGIEACVTVTLLDGLVLARSAFHHSMNYRSVVLFGRAERVDEEEEKRAALLAIVDHLEPGRSERSRPPSPAELRATLVARFPIDEGSAKVRTGGPVDDPADLALGHWAGVIPVRLVRGEPVQDVAAGAGG
jgi:nitroimidazol reductase NimA-like FMN-containing flavoprotein (pyridoxamine 5'-phosphate oxidase superfamily)